MKIAVTGGTGFLGRYILRQFREDGHDCRCLDRSQGTRRPTHPDGVVWVPGNLNDRESLTELVHGCDAVVHAAFDRPGRGFRGSEGNLASFVRTNVLGTIELIETARVAGAERLVFVSSCAVHEKILDDRPLDETHPLWPTTHYGAYKAAVEKFVHSYGYGADFGICAIRPCGIYGIAEPVERSKWFPLVADITAGRDVICHGGGKVVHAADVARGVSLLLVTEGVRGEAYNCCERYVSEWEIAHLVRSMTDSDSDIQGAERCAKHQILSCKLESLGFRFGGETLLRGTLEELIAMAKCGLG